ncbi:MAG: hypothetical protein IJ423_02030 [Clostridia bacterium]|nr:hypothetical protein [Clostridia bacterium]
MFLILFWPLLVISLINHYVIKKNKKVDAENEIERIEAESKNTINRLKLEHENKYNEYVHSFDSLVQEQSVRLAESELAIEVIEWMTDGFSKTIDTVDRRPHIERIDVPFVFSVYTNKITCNLGTYDFEIKRCSELKSPIQQTALAKAIASAIQVNIMMKYPQDISGTDVSINIEYEYKCESVYENGETKNNEYPDVKITYVAPNGNYQSVKEW